MKNPITVWQDNLTRYIQEQGEGDPNVLRDIADMHSRGSLRPGRITFGGEFAGPGIGAFRDKRVINGVLLGQEEIGSGHWYLFLVGVMSRNSEELEDVRLAGFALEQAGLRWRVAQRDPEAVKRYLAGPRGSFSVLTFPSPLDEYGLEVSGYGVMATEKRSGAVWEMDLKE